MKRFLGVGVGVHFIDAALLENNAALDGSETELGATPTSASTCASPAA